MSLTIGRLILKTAGRDAGKQGVIVDILDKHFVMIDGAVRRRKCNILHLEPMKKTIDIKKGASHEDVKKAFKAMKITLTDKKSKKKTEKPLRLRGKAKKQHQQLASAGKKTKGKAVKPKKEKTPLKKEKPNVEKEKS